MKWQGTISLAISASVVILATVFVAGCGHHDASVPRPTPVAVASGTQSATATGPGSATNNAANGAGSQAGNHSPVASNNQSIVVRNGQPGAAPKKERIIVGQGVGSLTVSIYGNNNNVTFVEAAKPSRSTISRSKVIQLNFFFESARQDIQKGQADSAIGQSGKALAVDPNNAATYNNRAIARYATGDSVGAAQDWRTAIRLEPANGVYQDNLVRASAGDGLVVLTTEHSVLSRRPTLADPQIPFQIENQSLQTLYFLRITSELLDRHGASIIKDSQDLPRGTNVGPQASIALPSLAGYDIFNKASKDPRVAWQTEIISPTDELVITVTFARTPYGSPEVSTFRYVPTGLLVGRIWRPKIED